MPSLRNFFTELKARNVRKTLAIYLGSALTTIGIIRLFAETYGLSTRFMPVVVTLLTCGLASAFLFGWYHGKEGRQPLQRREVLLHAVILMIAGVSAVRVGTSPPARITRILEKSIAILPFTNLSGKQDDEYFSNGVMEDILTQLAKINDLRVIAHSTVLKYKDTKKTPREIGDELGVAAILTGGVRRDGNRIRISGQLISTESETYIWAETYDREFENIFAIQSEVARRIAEGLRARITPDEEERVNSQPTANLEAYALVLRARDRRAKGTAEDNNAAIDLLQKALVLDNDFALAYAELGVAYRQRFIAYGYPRVWADSAIAVSRTAIEFDSASAEGHRALGGGYEALGKYHLALQSYNKAIELSPNYAAAISGVGWVAFYMGNLDDALGWMRKSVELEPDAASRYVNVGLLHSLLGEDSLARTWFTKSLALDPAILTTAYYHLIYLHLFNKNIAEARKHARMALEQSPNDIWTLHAFGDVELLAGNFAAARGYYERGVNHSSVVEGPGNQLAFSLLKLGDVRRAGTILDSNLIAFKRLCNDSPEDSYNPYVVATIYAMRDKATEAVSWLRIAVELGYSEYRWLAIDPMMDNVRTHPDFRRIMAKMKERQDVMHSRAHERGLFHPPPD